MKSDAAANPELGLLSNEVEDRASPVPPAPKRRRRFSWIRFFALIAFIVTPTLGFLYFALTTQSPLYSSEVEFAIRARDGQTSFSGLGALAGSLGVGLNGSNDIFALRSYLRSPGLFEIIDKETNFTKNAELPQRDWLVRLPADAPTEQRFRYFLDHVEVRLATLEQIVTVNVSAFSPSDARTVAEVVVRQSEEFINRLNDRAKEDFINFTTAEVRRAEERVTRTRLQITDWRNLNQQVDPQKTVEATIAIIAGLEGDLAKIRAEITQLENTTTDVTARLRQSKNREQALMVQIEKERSSIAGTGSKMAKMLSQYERLLIERDLAEKSYAAGIDALRAAQQEISQKQKYIVVTAEPSLAEERAFPLPVYHTALVFVGGLIAYLAFIFALALTRDYREMH
jgi:capsular polysaccharide transport system permease protein